MLHRLRSVHRDRRINMWGLPLEAGDPDPGCAHLKRVYGMRNVLAPNVYEVTMLLHHVFPVAEHLLGKPSSDSCVEATPVSNQGSGPQPQHKDVVLIHGSSRVVVGSPALLDRKYLLDGADYEPQVLMNSGPLRCLFRFLKLDLEEG